MKGVLRRQRKALNGLKLPSAGRAGRLEPNARNAFASKKTEGTAQQHQYAGNGKQWPELFHHAWP